MPSQIGTTFGVYATAPTISGNGFSALQSFGPYDNFSWKGNVSGSMTWIIGNHDPGFADHCGGTIAEEAEVDGLILRHEADPEERRPELSGHFHPKLRISRRGRQVSRRCFVATERKLILPAFGALTGGLDAHHPEIVRAVGGRAEALVPVADRLLRFPIAA